MGFRGGNWRRQNTPLLAYYGCQATSHFMSVPLNWCVLWRKLLCTILLKIEKRRGELFLCWVLLLELQVKCPQSHNFSQLHITSQQQANQNTKSFRKEFLFRFSLIYLPRASFISLPPLCPTTLISPPLPPSHLHTYIKIQNKTNLTKRNPISISIHPFPHAPFHACKFPTSMLIEILGKKTNERKNRA